MHEFVELKIILYKCFFDLLYSQCLSYTKFLQDYKKDMVRARGFTKN